MRTWKRAALPLLACTLLLSGCNLSDEDKKRIENAEDNIEKLALAPAILYPAENDSITGLTVVKVDVDESVEYEKVSLLIDGELIGEDIEAPYEFEWQPYFWAGEGAVTLLARAITSEGSLLRSNERTVTLSESAFDTSIALDGEIDTAYPFGTTSLELGWTELEGTSSYELQINEDTPVVTESASSVVQISTIGEYSIKIRATNALGKTGAWNQLAQFTLLPPTTPSVNSQTNDVNHDREISVSLDNNADYESVRLLVNGDVVESLDAPPYSFEWSPYYWTADTNGIYWSVIATTTDGLELMSETQYILPSDVVFTDFITIESPTENMTLVNVNSLRVSWTNIENASSYEYRVNDNIFSSESPEATIQLSELGEYDISVRATDANNRKGTWSQTVSVTLVGPSAPAFTAPSQNAQLSNVDHVSLNWESSLGASSYEYEFESITAATTETSATLTLENTGNYTIRARAIDGFGRAGEWSAPLSFSLLAPPTPQLNSIVTDDDQGFEISSSWNDANLMLELQVSKNAEFSELLDGFPESIVAGVTTHTVAIEPGYFFTRARFIDDYGRAGEWNYPNALVVGLFSINADVASYGWDTYDYPTDLLIDDDQLVLLSSKSNESDGSGDDFHVSKWSLEGTELWGRSLRSVAGSPRSLSKSTSGYIAVGTGNTWGDSVLLSLDSNGNFLWSYQDVGQRNAEGTIQRGENIYSAVETSPGVFTYIKSTYQYEEVDTNWVTVTDRKYSVVRYNRNESETTTSELAQPSSGEFGYISKLMFNDHDLYAAGAYTAPGDSYDASSDTYEPSVGESGAYLLNIDPDTNEILATRTGGGLSNASIASLTVGDYGALVGYDSYYAGGATLFDPVVGSESVVTGSISYSEAIFDPANGDVILIGEDRDSAVYGEPLVAIRYRDGLEINRTYIRKQSSDFNLRKVFWDNKYGIVILGTDDVGYSTYDTETIIYNLTRDFEYLE